MKPNLALLDKLTLEYDHINFEESENFSWSPKKNIIYYDSNSSHYEWSLLHEIGHVLCEHKDYKYDISLLKMEVEAWHKAVELSKKYDVKISQQHIEKCLDSYREWIYKRSSCPECTQAGIEKDTGKYQCINCGNKWTVSKQKFCRVYRKTVTE